MDLGYLIRGIRSLGLATSLASIRYSFMRDRLNRRHLGRQRGYPRPAGQLLRREPQPAGARFLFQSAELEVEFLKSSVVRVRWTPGSEPPPYALASTDQAPPQINVEKDGKDFRLASSQLTLTVFQNGAISYQSANGDLLRREQPPIRQGERWQQQSHLDEREIICGLGERASPLNLRPGSYRFWNTDAGGGYQVGDDPLYLCVPIFLSLSPAGSYLQFYENPHDGKLALGERADLTFEGGELRSIFIMGSPRQCLAQLAELIGHPALPPRWALGYHHSRWGYQDLEQIEDVVDGFVEHELPLDVLHLDIDYMDGYRVFTQDGDRFPDLTQLAKSLEERLSAKLVTILDPGVKIDPTYYLYRQGIEQNAFCQLPGGEPMAGVVWPGWVHFPDFSDAAVRAWWGQQYELLLRQGVAGFWHDMNEPTSFAAWGELAFPRATQHSVEGNGGDHRAIHNLYGLLMDKAGYEGLRKLQPDKRPWLLSRSGWIGLCRYAWHWTGDTDSSWDMLRTTLSTVIGLGLSGIPFSGPDIGGFSGHPSPELYLRWFQLAAFLPFFRNHSSKLSPPREPWTFDDEALGIIRRYLSLRREFMPYLYSLAEESHRHGWPMVRPLFWLEPAKQELWEVDDCFLLGDHLLVAPVLAPGAEQRQVQLPAGTWVDYWTDERHSGPGVVTLPAPLERMPLLVRAGAVLTRSEADELVLDLFPPEPGAPETGASLYQDAGDGYGPSRRDIFACQATKRGWQVAWDSEGEFPFPYKLVTLQFHPPLPAAVKIDGKDHPLASDRLQAAPFKLLEATWQR